jgi:hypothetical protein
MCDISNVALLKHSPPRGYPALRCHRGSRRRRARAAGARRAWRRRLAADLRFDGEQPGDALQRRLRDRRLGRGMHVIELAPRMPLFVREWPRLAGQAFLTETSQSCRGVRIRLDFCRKGRIAMCVGWWIWLPAGAFRARPAIFGALGRASVNSDAANQWSPNPCRPVPS